MKSADCRHTDAVVSGVAAPSRMLSSVAVVVVVSVVGVVGAVVEVVVVAVSASDVVEDTAADHVLRLLRRILDIIPIFWIKFFPFLFLFLFPFCFFFSF